MYRVESLLAAGWQEVRIVTDHGWLLMPGGLPKADLPKYLTATRWRRCAVVKESATVDVPCFPWFWAEEVRIACPPGIDCFMAGEEYSHGGLSLQECVVPQLSVLAGAQPAVIGENREREVGRAAMPGQGDGQIRRLQGRPAGQGGRPDHFAAVDRVSIRPLRDWAKSWARMATSSLVVQDETTRREGNARPRSFLLERRATSSSKTAGDGGG